MARSVLDNFRFIRQIALQCTYKFLSLAMKNLGKILSRSWPSFMAKPLLIIFIPGKISVLFKFLFCKDISRLWIRISTYMNGDANDYKIMHYLSNLLFNNWTTVCYSPFHLSRRKTRLWQSTPQSDFMLIWSVRSTEVHPSPADPFPSPDRLPSLWLSYAASAASAAAIASSSSSFRCEIKKFIPLKHLMELMLV